MNSGLYSFYPTIQIFSSNCSFFHSAGFMGFSILQSFRCRVQSLPNLPIIPFGSFWLENFHQLRTTFKRDSKSKFLGSNNIEASRGGVCRAWISRPITPRIVERDKDTGNSKSSHSWHESLEASLRTRSISESSFRRIQYFDAQQRIKESQDMKHPVKIFVIGVETTGFCRETGRIIEIAILDLLRDRNSCFQTLVKPEQHVPNSFVHGITMQMVNQPNVPRMKDLIPVLIDYIESRQIHGGVSLFTAHNGRCFDIPFLSKEFNRCSVEIPPNWLFLDTLPLARELMKLNESKPSSRVLTAGTS